MPSPRSGRKLVQDNVGTSDTHVPYVDGWLVVDAEGKLIYGFRRSLPQAEPGARISQTLWAQIKPSVQPSLSTSRPPGVFLCAMARLLTSPLFPLAPVANLAGTPPERWPVIIRLETIAQSTADSIAM